MKTGFQDCFRKFFDEQRDTVGALHDLRRDLFSERVVPGQPFDQDRSLSATEPAEGQRLHMRLTCPRRRKLGTEGDKQEERNTRCSLHCHVQQLT